VGPDQVHFDTTAFATVNEARFGTASFRALRGPGQKTWNFELLRIFRLRESVNVLLPSFRTRMAALTAVHSVRLPLPTEKGSFASAWEPALSSRLHT
jgi:hypothetical protein